MAQFINMRDIADEKRWTLFKEKLNYKICLMCNEMFGSFKISTRLCDHCKLKFKSKSGREMTRELVRVRDKHTCQECGLIRTLEQAKKTRKKSLDVHHLNGLCGKKSKGYDRVSEIDGLITLCHRCHFNRHDFSKMSV